MRLKQKVAPVQNSAVKYFAVRDGFGKVWVRSYRLTFAPSNPVSIGCNTRKQAEDAAHMAGYKLEGID